MYLTVLLTGYVPQIPSTSPACDDSEPPNDCAEVSDCRFVTMKSYCRPRRTPKQSAVISELAAVHIETALELEDRGRAPTQILATEQPELASAQPATEGLVIGMAALIVCVGNAVVRDAV